MIILIYNIVLHCLLIIGSPLLLFLVLTSKKRRKTVLQRLGIINVLKQYEKKVKIEKTIWIHALSVGEVISAQPLVNKLEENINGQSIVFSASTKTGFEIANKLFGKNKTVNSIFYFPYDIPFSIKQISSRIDPAYVIIVESDIWPNFLNQMKKRQIPVFLINARLSARSFKGYKKVGFLSKKIFSLFSAICTQTENDAARFKKLDIPSDKIIVTGNIKFDQKIPVNNANSSYAKAISDIKRNNTILLAGSTHEGEEVIILKAFTKLREKYPNTVLIIAPRNPERAEEVKNIVIKSGFTTVSITSLALEAKNPKVNVDLKIENNSFNLNTEIKHKNNINVIIVNTMGILSGLYEVADIAFIGGSLVACGGHNPLEPAVFSKPVIFGSDMSDFTLISQHLVEADGAFMVSNENELYTAFAKLIKDKTIREQTGKNAFKVFSSNKGAVNKTLKIINKKI